MKDKTIPAILRIDIEPDDHLQPEVEASEWSGFVGMEKLIENLRKSVADNSGHKMNPNWFVRFDPEIERRYGRADFVHFRHRQQFENLMKHGDPIGIHIHMHRWDDIKKVTYSDYADKDWVYHCLKSSCDVYQDCFGTQVTRSSQGGYFISEELIDALINLGIEADVSMEPGLPPKDDDISMGVYTTAPSTDFQNFPREPYFPSSNHMNLPSSSLSDRRPILLVPLTSYDYNLALSPWHKKLAHKLKGKQKKHLPLSPWKPWPSPKIFWDFVLAASAEIEKPYFACAIRTDNPESVTYKRAVELLEYLPKHPASKVLNFVDTLDEKIIKLAS